MKAAVKNSGFTLMEVVVSIGVVAVMSLSVSLVFGNITRLSQKPQAVSSAKNISHAVRLTLANANLCDNSLRPLGQNGATGTLVTMNVAAGGATASIGQIQLYDPNTGGDNKLIAAGDRVDANLILDRIDFFEARPGSGRSTLELAGVTYTNYAGFIQLTFKPVGDPGVTYDAAGNVTSAPVNGRSMVGGAPKPERIPVVLSVNPAGGIKYCYGNASYRDVCEAISGSMNAQGNCSATIQQKFFSVACPPSPTPACGGAEPYPTIPMWAITEFFADATRYGKPHCSCVLIRKSP